MFILSCAHLTLSRWKRENDDVDNNNNKNNDNDNDADGWWQWQWMLNFRATQPDYRT